MRPARVRAACVVAGVITGWAAVVGGSPGAAAVDTPIAISTTAVDFGVIPVGTTAQVAVHLANTGTSPFGPINLFGGEPPGPTFSTSQNCQGATLPPSGTCSIVYSLSSTVPGLFTDQSHFTVSQTVFQSDGEDFSVSLHGAVGNVVPDVTDLDFGSVPVGSTGELPITFTNVGPTSVTPTWSGGAPTDPTHFGGSQNCAGKTFAPGASCVFRYTFAPTSPGPHSATTAIGIDGSNVPVTLTGLGTAPIVPQPATVEFGPVVTGTTATRAVSLRNVSATAFGPINIAGGVPTAPGFSVDHECDGRTLAPDETCTVDYTFAPTEPASYAATSTLTVAGPTLVVPVPVTLAGEGVRPVPVNPYFTPLSAPVRLLDTRDGFLTVDHLHEGDGALVAGDTLTVPIAGRGGVPDSAVAVAINLTATSPTGPGFLTTFACDLLPSTSNVNFTAPGDTNPNAVLATLGDQGELCIHHGPAGTGRQVDVIVDAIGYFESSVGYVPLAQPSRLMDTRPAFETDDHGDQGEGPLTPNGSRSLVIAGRAGVGVGAAAVAINVTVTNTAAAGFVTVHPCVPTPPNASNVNFTAANVTTANAVIAKLDPAGAICLVSNTSTDVIVDVAGWFPDDTTFEPLAAPARLLDTRSGFDTIDGAFTGTELVAAGSVLELDVGGRAGLPLTGGSVALNVTATQTGGAGFLIVYSCDVERPNASHVNYTMPGSTRPNAVLARLAPDGRVCIYTHASTHLVVDVAGFLPAPPG